MTATEPFRITRRAVGGTAEIVEDLAPDDLAIPAAWLVERMELKSLLLGNRYSEDTQSGFVLTNWPLELLQRAIRERWHVRDVVAQAARESLGWVRPKDWLALATKDPNVRQRLDIRAEYGLPPPHSYRFNVLGVTGFVMISREAPLTPVEEKVLEFAGPSLFRIFIEQVRGNVNAGVTARERECLTLTARGLTAGEIATELSLSEHTVNAHMRNVMTKLGVANRAHAIAEAIRLGLIGYSAPESQRRV